MASKSDARAKTEERGKKVTSIDPVKPPESALLTAWLSSKPILAWAAVKPLLAGVDLRPYLFVTKDRKDYFGAALVLEHLAAVAEQLLGPKLAMQSMEAGLKRLAPLEAEHLFEAVRGRIVGGAVFEPNPPAWLAWWHYYECIRHCNPAFWTSSKACQPTSWGRGWSKDRKALLAIV